MAYNMPEAAKEAFEQFLKNVNTHSLFLVDPIIVTTAMLRDHERVTHLVTEEIEWYFKNLHINLNTAIVQYEEPYQFDDILSVIHTLIIFRPFQNKVHLVLKKHYSTLYKLKDAYLKQYSSCPDDVAHKLKEIENFFTDEFLPKDHGVIEKGNNSNLNLKRMVVENLNELYVKQYIYMHKRLNSKLTSDLRGLLTSVGVSLVKKLSELYGELGYKEIDLKKDEFEETTSIEVNLKTQNGANVAKKFNAYLFNFFVKSYANCIRKTKEIDEFDHLAYSKIYDYSRGILIVKNFNDLFLTVTYLTETLKTNKTFRLVALENNFSIENSDKYKGFRVVLQHIGTNLSYELSIMEYHLYQMFLFDYKFKKYQLDEVSKNDRIDFEYLVRLYNQEHKHSSASYLKFRRTQAMKNHTTPNFLKLNEYIKTNISYTMTIKDMRELYLSIDTENNSLRALDSTFKEVKSIPMPGSISYAYFHQGCKLFALCSGSIIQVFSLKHISKLYEFTAVKTIASCAIDKHKARVFWGGADGILVVKPLSRDIKEVEQNSREVEFGSIIATCAYDSGNQRYLVGGLKKVKVYDNTLNEVALIQPFNTVKCVDYNEVNDTYFAGGVGYFCVWSAKDFTVVKEIMLDYLVTYLTFIPDAFSYAIVLGREEPELLLIDSEDYDEITRYALQYFDLKASWYSPESYHFYMGNLQFDSRILMITNEYEHQIVYTREMNSSLQEDNNTNLISTF